MKLFGFLLAAILAHAQVARITCRVAADTWVEAPPFSRGGESPATQNHGADKQLVLNGRNDFALVQFDVSPLRGLKVQRATLRVRQTAGAVPLTMIGISSLSGSGPWSEASSNYFFAEAGSRPWAY